MPTYDYKCKKCGFEFEQFQSIKDDALTDCIKCDGTVQRLISKNVNIQFVGSGFYVNDKNKSKSESKNTKTK
ncbi:MAG: FmdB family transcriptional regulator [Rickettsiales bacterium]|nr:FmdB family transcriptional regulator [Rickettsiales bacterium]|tara:strand:- start:6188 stop:6403 length:216 start_codon:yes stop_codon:yes gene_type:complete